MADEPNLEWEFTDQLIQLLMRIDAKLDLLIDLYEEGDGEEEDDG